jgi:hypothetical protein
MRCFNFGSNISFVWSKVCCNFWKGEVCCCRQRARYSVSPKLPVECVLVECLISTKNNETLPGVNLNENFERAGGELHIDLQPAGLRRRLQRRRRRVAGRGRRFAAFPVALRCHLHARRHPGRQQNRPGPLAMRLLTRYNLIQSNSIQFNPIQSKSIISCAFVSSPPAPRPNEMFERVDLMSPRRPIIF